MKGLTNTTELWGGGGKLPLPATNPSARTHQMHASIPSCCEHAANEQAIDQLTLHMYTLAQHPPTSPHPHPCKTTPTASHNHKQPHPHTQIYPHTHTHSQGSPAWLCSTCERLAPYGRHTCVSWGAWCGGRRVPPAPGTERSSRHHPAHQGRGNTSQPCLHLGLVYCGWASIGNTFFFCFCFFFVFFFVCLVCVFSPTRHATALHFAQDCGNATHQNFIQEKAHRVDKNGV